MGTREAAPAPVRALQLAAEVMMIGVLVCLASLPGVTVLAALGAGSVLLWELVDADRTPTVRRFLTLLGRSLRQPVVTLAPAALVAVAGLDALALLGGAPGAALLGPVTAAALLLVLLVGLRAAARWHPERPWRAVLADAVPVVLRDWPGSLLLAGALVVIAVVARQVPTFTIILPGLLVMSVVAVERRRRPGRVATPKH
jgi:hypothetical protein